MDRRTTFKKFLGVEAAATVGNHRQEDALPLGGGLTPYSGTWNYAIAAHLLRRAMFGPTHQQILDAVRDGMDKTLDKLFTPVQLPMDPVIYSDNPIDPNVIKGQPWVKTPLNPSVQGNVAFKENSLFAWMMEQIYKEGVSITEKMTLFWHNHFVVSEIFDPRMSFDYIQLLRSNCLKNFKELTKQITVDKAMLYYLNGNQNTNLAPNENYARELMELFTLGKGDLAGPGDYTTFTEQDVMEVAKALTGWYVPVDRRNTTYQPLAVFDSNLHDKSTKTLSHRFNNTKIVNAGANEYKQVIDVIFQKREAATFISRKLYRYFIYYKVSSAIESDIVDGLADTLVANNFDIAPVVRELLSSSHFYTDESLGALIRPPYEFVFNTLKAMKFNSSQVSSIEDTYNLYLHLYRSTNGLQQVYFDVPSVAGWTPYYQEPSFHEIWVNSVTLPLRTALTTGLATKTIKVRNIAQKLFGLELTNYVSDFSAPGDATRLINDIVAHLLPKPIYQNQLDYLKSKLLGNMTEAQWKTNWDAFIASPNDAQKKAAVENRLKLLISNLLTMPEYYLS
ncbi:MAG: DUF1800 domain-containing protein [Saprospiraceae bacterium]|jgi:uncharacterized protein (DUF1800 family)